MGKHTFMLGLLSSLIRPIIARVDFGEEWDPPKSGLFEPGFTLQNLTFDQFFAPKNQEKWLWPPPEKYSSYASGYGTVHYIKKKKKKQANKQKNKKNKKNKTKKTGEAKFMVKEGVFALWQ